MLSVQVLLQLQVGLAHSVSLPHNQVNPQFLVVSLHLPVAVVSVHLANLLLPLILLVGSVKVLLGLSGSQLHKHKHRLSHLLLVHSDSLNSHSNPVLAPSVSHQLLLHQLFPLALAPLAQVTHSGLILEFLDNPVNHLILEHSVLNQPLDKPLLLPLLPIHLALLPQVLVHLALLLLLPLLSVLHLLHLQPLLDSAVNNPLSMPLLLLPLPVPLDPLALLSHRDSPLLPSVSLPLLELVSVKIH